MVVLSAGRGGIHAIADENALHRVLVVLLENAINYTASGGCITVMLYLAGAEVAIQIHDTGIGIPPEDQEMLYEPFRRGMNTANISGTGLGLVVVKKCVELHHGEITVQSQVGVGTTFTVTLPQV